MPYAGLPGSCTTKSRVPLQAGKTIFGSHADLNAWRGSSSICMGHWWSCKGRLYGGPPNCEHDQQGTFHAPDSREMMYHISISLLSCNKVTMPRVLLTIS